MRFKIDENLPVDVALLLRDEGHDAMTVNEEGLAGCPDSNIARICQNEDRVLITLDLDFSDIRVYPPNGFCEARGTLQEDYFITYSTLIIEIRKKSLKV